MMLLLRRSSRGACFWVCSCGLEQPGLLSSPLLAEVSIEKYHPQGCEASKCSEDYNVGHCRAVELQKVEASAGLNARWTVDFHLWRDLRLPLWLRLRVPHLVCGRCGRLLTSPRSLCLLTCLICGSSEIVLASSVSRWSSSSSLVSRWSSSFSLVLMCSDHYLGSLGFLLFLFLCLLVFLMG